MIAVVKRIKVSIKMPSSVLNNNNVLPNENSFSSQALTFPSVK